MTVDLTQFHGAFFEESFEAIDSMEAALLKLDAGAPDQELINTIFRVAHSIKGGSATFGFGEIASFTHSLETLLDELRSGSMQVTLATSDLLLKSVDVMRAMLRCVQAQQPIDAQRVSDLQFDLELMIARKTAVAAAASPGAAAGASRAQAPATAEPRASRWRIAFRPYPQLFARGIDPLRMLRELSALGALQVRAELADVPRFADLDPRSCYLGWSLELNGSVTHGDIAQVFEWAEGDCALQIELLDTPMQEPPVAVATQPVASSAEPAAAGAKPTADAPQLGAHDSGSIRVNVEKIDELMNTVGELVITQSMLSQLGASIDGPGAAKLRAGLAQLERNMRELQESVMRVRMLPINVVFSRFPRMVRDLAQRLGKQIELRLTGEQTELDKTVLEKIGDPLVHLLRNSIDHGIELPDARLAAGKSPTGVVHMDACHRGGNIAVEVRDDGGGLNRDRILAKARERGLVGPHDVLTDEQIYELVFMPGFSTADQPTDVSGRGVGMDVVRRNVMELGGQIELRSEPGKGSKCVITLPLTLAIVEGQSVAVGTETYIIPLISMVESMQLRSTSVSRVAGRGEVFLFRGYYLPIVRLHELFGVQPRTRDLDEGLVVVAEGESHQRIGLFVDDLLSQQQVVIKSLEANYGYVEGVSGATILGDGSVALILDIPEIIRALSVRAAA
ncbi:MAG TPA: chemotaxis protein CheA [Steroidobacteraceae bacterium]